MPTDEIKEKLFRIKKESGMLLLEIRQRNGLTQQFVAESTDMSCENIHAIERKYKATMDEVFKLYAFYHSQKHGTTEDESRLQKIMTDR